MQAKLKYQMARDLGKSNEEIAKEYNVKKSTVDRAIGSDRKFKEEKNMGINSKMAQTRIVKRPKEEAPKSDATSQPREVLKTITINCCDCGRTFSVNPAEQNFFKRKGLNLPKRCPECREKRKKVETRICVDCGAEFTITRTNLEYFKRIGMHAPKRCEECRKNKREHNAEMERKKAIKEAEELGIVKDDDAQS